jgi:hypothetical protein
MSETFQCFHCSVKCKLRTITINGPKYCPIVGEIVKWQKVVPKQKPPKQLKLEGR